jgi:hypothetical protein
MIFILGIGLLTILGMGCTSVPSKDRRTVELVLSSPAGKVLGVLPLPHGRFVHRYIHSVHKSPVDEYFEVREGTLHLYELRYDQSSVGMPSDAEGGYRLENGRFVLKMDRSFSRISIMVSPLPGHGIEVEGRFFPFTLWVPREDPIVLTARTLD